MIWIAREKTSYRPLRRSCNKRMTSLRRMLFCAAAGVLVGFGSASAERIRIGVTNYNLTYLSSGVALKSGFFRAEGLDAEIIRMTPDVSVMAITGGDIDYSIDRKSTRLNSSHEWI